MTLSSLVWTIFYFILASGSIIKDPRRPGSRNLRHGIKFRVDSNIRPDVFFSGRSSDFALLLAAEGIYWLLKPFLYGLWTVFREAVVSDKGLEVL